jgi:hypothetical protein
MTDLGKYTFDTSGGSSSIMVRKDASGNVVETESERIPYDPIPKGTYLLEITGFQAPFEMPRPAQFAREEWQSETVTKTRLEFTILEGEHAGKLFTCLYTLSFNDRANLGQLLRAIEQGPLPRQFAMPQSIGWTFRAHVIHSIDKSTGKVKTGRDGNEFPEILIGSIEPVAVDLPPELKTTPRAAKPSPKASPAMTDDPRLSWSALWAFTKQYGFPGPKEVSKELKTDLDNLGCEEIYQMFCEHVGVEAA